jgi:hypothetical protein
MILTLGDSFTYGDELDDRVNQAWPYLLGRMLNQPVTNLGQSGSCNTSMVRKLLAHTSHSKYNLVVIGWTDPNRFEVWDERILGPNTVIPGSQSGLPWINDYYRYSYDTQWAWERWVEQVILTQEYLTAQNQPYLFICVSGQMEYDNRSQLIESLCQQIRSDRFVGWPDRGMIELTKGCPLGPDWPKDMKK